MAHDRCKWDIDELTGNLNVLRREQSNLREYLIFLRNVRREIDESWESIAGTQFDNYVSADEQDLQFVLLGIGELIEKLDKVISLCYQECEDKISQKMWELQGSIRRI